MESTSQKSITQKYYLTVQTVEFQESSIAAVTVPVNLAK